MIKPLSTIKIILVTIALFTLSLPLVSFAQGSKDAPPPASGSSSDSSSTGDSALSATPTPDDLFYKFNYTNTDTSKTNIGAVNVISTKNSWQTVLAGIVKTLLNVSGGLALIGLTVGGVFLVTARGKSDQVEKGKKIVVYSIIGLIIIAVSYALVIGVSDLQFFTPGAGGGATSGSDTTGGGAPAAPAPGTASAPGGVSGT